MSSKVLLIYTGGTIGMVKSPNAASLYPIDFNNLLDNISELELLNCKIQIISLETPIDSSNINTFHWVEIAGLIEENYKYYDGFVVLHGTDTMSYSASALSFMLENLQKPVIFTGSQLPIGDLRTDAKENLITSVQLASLKKDEIPVIKEVCLYFEYKLFRGNRSTKINADHFKAFASKNFPPLATSGVRINLRSDLLLNPAVNSDLLVHKDLSTDVALLKLFPGIQQTIISSILDTENLKGVVLETYGSGNAPTAKWFLDLIEKAILNGIYIVNVTQCSGGKVEMGHYATSAKMQSLGVISASDMTTEAAITKMMFLLSVRTGLDFKLAFKNSLRGEISKN
ncbi:MAG: L-asparaginase 1 [Flavobacteriaceae bacterium]|nr:L-asparaginase 1 [Flavobacteriaceae bacterium]|tara:strand:- start:100 stop:1125 length:1026 start_codon:yes stop_codon:yes gene_type:complete